MLNGIVAKIISHLCGQYIEKIDSSQLELEIWNGKAHMENVKIMENSFLAHQIPFRVKYGLISSLSLTFPWSRLSTEPCIVDVENVLIVGEIFGGALITQDLTVQKNEDESEITEQTMWDKMLTTILDNLIINFRNVHLRIEARIENQNYISVGIVIPAINAFTVDKEGNKVILEEHQNLVLKKVTVTNFGIYVDTDSTEIDLTNQESFKSKMISDITSDHHQFILNPFSFDGIFSNDQNALKSTFSMISSKIELILDNSQYKGMQILMNQYKLFCRQRIFSHCGRPDRPPRSERSSTLWWCYAHRCSLDKNNWNLLDIKDVLEMLKNRKKYYGIWQNYITNSENYKSEILAFEDKLDSNTVTLLRSYSTFIYQKKINSIEGKYTEKEIEEVSKDIKKAKKGPFTLNLDLKSLIFSLKENKNSDALTSFNINNLNTQFIKIGFDNSASFQLESFYIMNYMSKRYPKTLEAKNGISGSFKINYNEPYQVLLKVSPIFAVIDAEWIAKMFMFFEKRRIFLDSNDQSQKIHQIQEIINSHTKLKLDLEISNSKFIVPYQEIEAEKQISFDLSFNSFTLNSSPSPKYNLKEFDSLYDNYKISISDIQLYLDDKKMSDKFNFNSNFKVAILTSEQFDSIKAEFEFTSLKLYLTTFQALLIKEISAYFFDTIKMNVEESSNSITAENKFSIKIPDVSLSILYEQKNLYQIDIEKQTNIEVTNQNKITKLSILNEESGLKCLEFLASEKGKFFNTQKIDCQIEFSSKYQKIDLDFGDSELFAKAKPLNFLIVFFKSPKNYEWKLKLNQESSIEKYIHKSKYENIDDKTAQVKIKINKTIAHLIDFNTAKNGDENELLQLVTKEIFVSVEKTPITFHVDVDISPPKITTNQHGNIWTDIISDDDLMSSPIQLKLGPASFSLNFNSLKANVYPLLLFKIISFIKITKNSHCHVDGDPDTMSYMRFDINAINSKIKVIYNTESTNYYELNIPNFKFVTIEAPTIHQISFDSIEIIDKNHYSKEIVNDNAITEYILKNNNKLFDVYNLKITLDMKFLLNENFDHKEIKTFDSIMQEKGLEKWTEETMNLIKTEKNELKLDDMHFYFYAISFKFEFDNLLCTYSHRFARDITFLTSNLLKIFKCDSLYNYKDDDIQEIDEPLDICLIFITKKIDFIVLNEIPVSILSIENAQAQVELQNEDYSIEINKITLVDRQKSKILDAGDFSLKSSEDEIYGSLDYFDLTIFLDYVPLSVDYIMNCPFFSFADEFKKKKAKPTSFEMLKSIFFAINNLSIKLPLKDNLFLFNVAFDASLHPTGRIAQIRDIQMLLNDRLIIKPFSVNFDNDKWFIDPVFITFSVFELYIIEQLIDKIKSLSMPKIYLSKKEVEMSRRKFVIYISTVKFILTQPNLPFLWLEIKPSIFKQSFSDQNGGEKIIEYKIETLIKHANYSNCGFDTVVDPFVVTFQSKNSNKSSSTNIDISPITFSVSSSFIKEIFVFRKKFQMFKLSKNDSKIFQDEIIFFQNDTGLPITLTLFNGKSKKMKISEKDEDENEGEITVLSDDTPYRMNNFNPEYDIKVSFLDHSVYFSIRDLCFPVFFENTAVAYIVADIGVQTIHFSSPYVVQNDLPYNIEVFVGDETIGEIKSGFQKPIPLNSTSSLAEGIRAAMTPVRTEISPPVRILKYHSFTLLYKIIDNKAFRDLYSTIYVSVDPKQSISYITFMPNITFINHLPVNVNLIFYDEFDEFSFGERIEYKIETGKSIDASFIRTNRSSITIKLVIDQFGESEPITIYPFGTSPVPFEFVIKNKYEEICKVAVMSIYSPDKMVFQILIFTPCVMYNETGTSILVNESKKSYQRYPFINKMHFYTPKGFFKKKKVTARVVYPDKTFPNVNSFDCMHPNTLQTVPLPYIEDNTTFFLLSVITKEAPVQFNHTTIVTLMTSLCVINHFNETVFFSPSGNPKFTNTCLPNKRTALIYSNALSSFDVYVRGYKKCKNVALVNPTTTVFRLLSENGNQPDFLIQLDLIKEESGFCGHISYPSLPTPTVITNMLENKIIYAYQDDSSSINQENDNKNAVVINSMSTSLFAKEQPFIENNLNCGNNIILTIGENEITFPVSFASDTEPVRIQSSNYFYEVRTTKRGNQMVIITEIGSSQLLSTNNNNDNNNNDVVDDGTENDEIVHVENLKQKIINVSLSKIQVSFIDSLMHELCLLTIKNILLKENMKKSIQLTIDSIQLDDMYVASKSPVVLFSTYQKFLTATLKSELPFNTHSFDSIELKFAEIRLFADYAFINDLYSAITEIHEESKMAMDYNPAKKIKKQRSMRNSIIFDTRNPITTTSNNNNNNDNDSTNNNNNENDNNNSNNNNNDNDNNNDNNNNNNDSNNNDNNNNDNNNDNDDIIAWSGSDFNDDKRENQEDEIFRSSSFYSIKSFKVSPIRLILNFRGSSGRQLIFPPSTDFKISMLRFVPNVTGGKMELPQVEINGVRAPLDAFRKHLIGSYRNQFIKEAVKVLFHADLLLNVVGVAKGVVGVFTDKTKTKKEALTNLGGQLLQSVEGIMRILPSNIHLANSSAKQSKKSRFSKFIGNVANALDKGADKINSTKQELTDETVPLPQRQPRAFPMGRIISITTNSSNDDDNNDNDNGVYGGLNGGYCGSSLRISIAQNTFQKLYKNVPDHADERLLAFVDSDRNVNSNTQSYALAIFDHYVAVLSSNLQIVILEARINEIVSAEFKEKSIMLVVYDKYEKIQTFCFECKNESEARSISTIIRSVAARMNLFTE